MKPKIRRTRPQLSVDRCKLIEDAIQFFTTCKSSDDAQLVLSEYHKLHLKGLIDHSDYKTIVEIAQMQRYDI